MAIDRRGFLHSLTAASITALFPTVTLAQHSSAQRIIGACRISENTYGLSSVDLTGKLLWQLSLPARAHDTVIHSDGVIGTVIARRPGNFITLFNVADGTEYQSLRMPDEIKLNGHAIWLNDELVVTASDRFSSEMRLLRFSFNNLTRQLQLTDTISFPFFGAHEIIKVDNHVIVAVGGLKTQGRVVTNKEHFESLVISLHPATLQIENLYSSPVAGVSLRHLSADGRDIYIAGQYQGSPTTSETLLFKIQGTELVAFSAEKQFWSSIHGYVGSILATEDHIIATSPRAHWIGWFNKNSLTLATQYLTQDVCALVNTEQGIFAGTGTGRLYHAGKLMPSGVIWDNHFTAAST